MKLSVWGAAEDWCVAKAIRAKVEGLTVDETGTSLIAFVYFFFFRSNRSPISPPHLKCSELPVLFRMIDEKKTVQAIQRDAFTLKETAAKLGISYMSAFRLVKRGLLKPCVALRIKLISQKEIDRFLREGQAL